MEQYSYYQQPQIRNQASVTSVWKPSADLNDKLSQNVIGRSSIQHRVSSKLSVSRYSLPGNVSIVKLKGSSPAYQLAYLPSIHSLPKEALGSSDSLTRAKLRGPKLILPPSRESFKWPRSENLMLVKSANTASFTGANGIERPMPKPERPSNLASPTSIKHNVSNFPSTLLSRPLPNTRRSLQLDTQDLLGLRGPFTGDSSLKSLGPVEQTRLQTENRGAFRVSDRDLKAKAKERTSRFLRFSPSRVSADPRSAVGAVVMSPGVPDCCYRIEKMLQSAIYGAVYLASEFPTKGGERKRKVALKVILREVERKHKNNLQEDSRAEIEFRADMEGHENVLVFDHCWEERESLFIVMPLAEYEDLFEVLKKRETPFGEGEARWLFAQLLAAADFLHEKGIAFRDHSLENVLMFYDHNQKVVVPKITDPGQAVRFVKDCYGKVKELRSDRLFGKSFRPPEVYLRELYNPVKIDTFCLGWMLFFIVTKHQIFDRAADTDPFWRLLVRGKHKELLKQRGGCCLSSSLQQLLWKMLNPNPNARPTVRDCLDDPWFKGTHYPVDNYSLYGSRSLRSRLKSSTLKKIEEMQAKQPALNPHDELVKPPVPSCDSQSAHRNKISYTKLEQPTSKYLPMSSTENTILKQTVTVPALRSSIESKFKVDLSTREQESGFEQLVAMGNQKKHTEPRVISTLNFSRGPSANSHRAFHQEKSISQEFMDSHNLEVSCNFSAQKFKEAALKDRSFSSTGHRLEPINQQEGFIVDCHELNVPPIKKSLTLILNDKENAKKQLSNQAAAEGVCDPCFSNLSSPEIPMESGLGLRDLIAPRRMLDVGVTASFSKSFALPKVEAKSNPPANVDDSLIYEESLYPPVQFNSTQKDAARSRELKPSTELDQRLATCELNSINEIPKEVSSRLESENNNSTPWALSIPIYDRRKSSRMKICPKYQDLLAEVIPSPAQYMKRLRRCESLNDTDSTVAKKPQAPLLENLSMHWISSEADEKSNDLTETKNLDVDDEGFSACCNSTKKLLGKSNLSIIDLSPRHANILPFDGSEASINADPNDVASDTMRNLLPATVSTSPSPISAGKERNLSDENSEGEISPLKISLKQVLTLDSDTINPTAASAARSTMPTCSNSKVPATSPAVPIEMLQMAVSEKRITADASKELKSIPEAGLLAKSSGKPTVGQGSSTADPLSLKASKSSVSSEFQDRTKILQQSYDASKDPKQPSGKTMTLVSLNGISLSKKGNKCVSRSLGRESRERIPDKGQKLPKQSTEKITRGLEPPELQAGSLKPSDFLKDSHYSNLACDEDVQHRLEENFVTPPAIKAEQPKVKEEVVPSAVLKYNKNKEKPENPSELDDENNLISKSTEFKRVRRRIEVPLKRQLMLGNSNDNSLGNINGKLRISPHHEVDPLVGRLRKANDQVGPKEKQAIKLVSTTLSIASQIPHLPNELVAESERRESLSFSVPTALGASTIPQDKPFQPLKSSNQSSPKDTQNLVSRPECSRNNKLNLKMASQTLLPVVSANAKRGHELLSPSDVKFDAPFKTSMLSSSFENLPFETMGSPLGQLLGSSFHPQPQNKNCICLSPLAPGYHVSPKSPKTQGIQDPAQVEGHMRSSNSSFPSFGKAGCQNAMWNSPSSFSGGRTNKARDSWINVTAQHDKQQKTPEGFQAGRSPSQMQPYLQRGDLIRGGICSSVVRGSVGQTNTIVNAHMSHNAGSVYNTVSSPVKMVSPIAHKSGLCYSGSSTRFIAQ